MRFLLFEIFQSMFLKDLSSEKMGQFVLSKGIQKFIPAGGCPAFNSLSAFGLDIS